MNDYKRFGVSKDKYNHCVRTQLINGTPFREHVHGSRRNLFIRNNQKLSVTYSPESKLDLGELSEAKFVSFLATFSKHLYQRLMTDEALFHKQVKFKGSAKSKNIDFWNAMPVGVAFYNIDLSSAYWQVLKRLGYISNDMYVKYQNDAYKNAKRYGVTFLARKNKMNYTNPDKYTITCDTTCLNRVYDNVRSELYNCIADVVALCDNNYIEFNIDGISVRSNMVDTVKAGFNSLGLDYKITRCSKLSEREYKYGSKIRYFKK
jgi:hypothetical protein